MLCWLDWSIYLPHLGTYLPTTYLPTYLRITVLGIYRLDLFTIVATFLIMPLSSFSIGCIIYGVFY